MNAAAPRIQSPEGEPVHDIHAARITREMLVFLETENKRLWTGTVDALRTQQMGNPVGQRRAVEQFKRAAGPLALDIRLKPGKRGHCELTVAAWTIWDAAKGALVDPLRRELDGDDRLAGGASRPSRRPGPARARMDRRDQPIADLPRVPQSRAA